MCKWTRIYAVYFHLLHKILSAASSSHNTVATCSQEQHRIRIAINAMLFNANRFPIEKKIKPNL